MAHFTDRSRLQTGSRCQRKRWWQYHAGTKGIGLSKVRKSAPLVTGAAVHEGFAHLLQFGGQAGGWTNLPTVSSPIIEGAVTKALNYFDTELNVAQGGGLDYTPDEPGQQDSTQDQSPDQMAAVDNAQQQWLIAQQKGLVEALVRLSGIRIVPNLLRDFDVPLVEQEMAVRLPKSGAIFQSRADGLLRSKGTGEQYALSLKTVAQWSKWKDSEILVDAQGLTEPYVLEANGFGEVAGAQMIYLIKGREMWNSYERRPETYNHLIRAWADRSGASVEWAWKYNWTDPLTGRGRKLGSGYKPVYWFNEPDGVRVWMEMLATGQVQPDIGGDPLGGWVMPTPIYRNQDQRQLWMDQADQAEVKVQEKLVQIAQGADPLKVFAPPLDRITCTALGRCECWDLCWGPEWKRRGIEGPEESGEWVVRKPHHSGEKEMVDGNVAN